MLRFPVPRKELVELSGAMISDAGEDIAEIRFGIDAVELAGLDTRVDGGSTFAALVVRGGGMDLRATGS